MGSPLRKGGFADVRKHKYRGREVAVKDLQVHYHTDKELRDVTNVSNWLVVVFPPIDQSVLTFAEVLQGGHNLEVSSASERIATARSDTDRESICHGVEVDGEREYQRVCDSAPGRESV